MDPNESAGVKRAAHWNSAPGDTGSLAALVSSSGSATAASASQLASRSKMRWLPPAFPIAAVAGMAVQLALKGAPTTALLALLLGCA